MDKDLQELIDRAKKIKMTKKEMEKQRISWAYGNLKLSRENITKREIIKAARKLRGK